MITLSEADRSGLDRTTQFALFLAERHTGAFRIQTGISPHTVLHCDNKARLLYFAPSSRNASCDSAGSGAKRPVFISMPLINTWTIFDLLPGRSVIERLVAAGHAVYLVDWGRPGPEDKDTPLTRYVDTTLGRMADRALRHVAAQTPADVEPVDQLDAIGYCVGGTFLTMHVARHPARFRRLCTLATPIDFHASGRLAAWSKPAHFPLDALIDGIGNYPKEMMRESFKMLRPTGDAAKWQGLWSRIEDPGFRTLWAALEEWNGDGVDFPGEAYREYVRRCYFDNALIAGGWAMDGTPVDLRAGAVPVHVIAAAADHIVPPPAAFGLASVWGRDLPPPSGSAGGLGWPEAGGGLVSTQTIRGGHVGVCVGSELPNALLTWLEQP